MGRAFGAAGWRVAVVDVSPAGAAAQEELAGCGVEACFVQADVSRSDAVRSAVDEVTSRWGALDCVINNAGVLGRSAPIDELEEEDLDHVLDVNLKGTALVCKFAVRAQRERRGGSILNVASISADAGAPYYPAYSAAKAGVIALTRSIARQVGRYNIRVNCLSPGSITGTALMPPRSVAQRREEMAGLLRRSPRGRAGRPEDVAGLALFLASPQAEHIHGAVFTVDGGESLGYE
jgi:NAD(P)-dependent dehydrogenase (short-subunit alcohol dehydrogenase family)